MHSRSFVTGVLAVILLAVGGAASVAAQDFELTVENIMRGPELVGSAPQRLRGGGGFSGGGAVFSWSPDSRYIYFRWQQPGVDTTAVPYRVAAGGGDPERIPDEVADTVLAGRAVWSPDGRRAIYSVSEDLVLWDDGRKRFLTETFENEQAPRWSADGESIFFLRGGNAFAMDLERGAIRQLTDIRRGDAPREPTESQGQRKFLIDQQQELFDVIRRGVTTQAVGVDAQGGEEDDRPKPFYPGADRTAGGMQVSPNGDYVLLTVTERPRGSQQTEMAVWVTDDGYASTRNIRTKVGDVQSKSRAAILEVATGEVTFVGDSVGTGDRNMRGLAVSPNSRHALVRVETHDNEDRWYVVVDLPSMEERVVDHLHDDAWLAGPSYNTAGFMPDGETVYFGSETTGWAHLYTVPAVGGEAQALTSGEWEVLSARLSPDGETWYITANKEGFGEIHFYTMQAGGGTLTQVTRTVGRQDVEVSPDGRRLAIRHSEANRPPELYVQENRAGREMRQVTLSTTEEWRSYDWIVPEIVTIPANDGVGVPARLYQPHNPVPAGQRPAVIFVHGAGYTQNVHNWWSNYYREYMFHHLLASEGYTVIDIDYRASAGHGRDWRTAIYRHMGGRDLDDQVDGARWLVENMGIHPEKIGIYGGSYGGFISLMAMFTKPGVFKAGAALRPVTDWAHYNHGYTSNILNEPQHDTLAYKRSSPIYFAEGLEGHLLMAHGMVDDNVHFLDTVRLTQRLIELKKENWEVAMYPVEPHGFRQITSWIDEYRRIHKLFERTLK
jgi:dipeptidyl aminopeptidase/acylaminoacyl peptidase